MLGSSDRYVALTFHPSSGLIFFLNYSKAESSMNQISLLYSEMHTLVFFFTQVCSRSSLSDLCPYESSLSWTISPVLAMLLILR